MYQLLLVDDEPSIVESLALTIPWREMGVDTIHQSHSAFEALQILKNHNVDIVMTDIKMPGMSGLELIEQIKKDYEGIRCILLSGYEDFQYAQQAIKFGVSNYLLKPIKDEELIETVENVIKEMEREAANDFSFNLAISTIKNNLSLLRRNLISALLQGIPISQDTLEERLDLLEISLQPHDLVFLLHVRLEVKCSDWNGLNDDLIKFSLENIVEEILLDYFPFCLCVDHNGEAVFVVKLQKDMGEGDYKNLIHQAQEAIQTNLEKYFGWKIVISHGSRGLFPQDMATMYKDSIGKDTREKIAVPLNKEDDCYASLIYRVQTYIDENLNKDVSLQRIADYVYLHPVYLSKIYKMETGEGISDYISKLRMKKAKQYLLASNCKICDVAKKIGYQNTSYFIKVFKSFFGQTPQEFRQTRFQYVDLKKNKMAYLD